jgi:catechol 1,2-dioxygenase
MEFPMPSSAYFAEDRSVEAVNARMTEAANPRLREVLAIVVSHLHAAVKEARVTGEEWMAAIRFLTETGQMCTDWRQEFILLSDVLGVSMLVDAINHQRPLGSTENTVLGPFHVSDAPRYANGANISLDGEGEPLLVSGRVLDPEGRPIAGATLDVWQANADGFYDVQQPDVQPPMNLRGVFTTDAEGRFWFRSAKPRHYPIPDDGPVGKLLKGLGRHPNRAAHLHFIVEAGGYDRIVTHIFTPDCQYLGEDAVFGVKQSLIADFRQVEDPERAAELGFTSPFWSVQWDVVMACS